MSTHCTEPARTTPVLGTFDVIVCGGGAAGCAAAIASARHGARTLLVERDGHLGGATVSQLVAHILSTNGVDFQGIWHEWARTLHARGGLAHGRLLRQGDQIRGGVDPELVKFAWDDLITGAGAEQLLHSWCAGALIEDGDCTGLLVETRAGRRALRAARVVDCTADGAICAAAGVPWQQGDGIHPWGQALTKVFRMGGVRWPAEGYDQEALDLAQTALAEAVDQGAYDSPVIRNGRVLRYGTGHWVHQSVMPQRAEHNEFPSRVLRVDPLDPFDLTRAEREGREQARQCAEALRACVPGYEAAYLLDTSAHIGIRDSRRIQGRATVTAADAWDFRKHPDGIARSSWHIDIWPADSYDAPAVPHGDPAYEERTQALRAGAFFDIPYGCLVAQGVDNLLVAGRCLSAEREAQASLRIQQTCQATGQAAGTAAALSLAAGLPPSELDAQVLVKQLARDRDIEPAFPEIA